MGSNLKFDITFHARLRFVERFSEEKYKFAHLSRCHGCIECDKLVYRLKWLTNNYKEHWESLICEKLQAAEDVRIYLNDSNFMEHMYSKYGYGRYRFLVEGDILFVVTDDDDNVVITCMNVHNPVNGSRIIANFASRPKFRKKVSK